MTHSFDVEIAQKYGVDEAIVLNHLFFWIQKNQADRMNFNDGHYWTYSSIEAFTEIFPYWSAPQIKRTLKRMEEKGMIITGNYNKDPRDRTKWYAISDSACSILQNRLPQRTKSSATLDGIVQPLPDKSTDISTDNTPTVPQGGEHEKFSERFEHFWKHYPRKTGKGAAESSFMKYKPSEELTRKMIDAVDALKASEQWQKDGGRFIPLPATWLNQKRWEDEIPQGNGGGDEDNWGGIPKL